ncbi:MAG TPA: hypothetical protein VHT34_05940 [Clostridia bacterium]|nr:hypothetical protein [Clostridia bacterium]
MIRQVNTHEKDLFEVVKEFNNSFYYQNIFRVIDNEQYKVKIEKNKEEMVGRALINFQNGDRLDYEIRYNRIVNLSEGYTLLVPGIKVG